MLPSMLMLLNPVFLSVLCQFLDGLHAAGLTPVPHPSKSWPRERTDRFSRQPWRSRTIIHIPSPGNSTDKNFFRRAGRFVDFSDENWMQVDESSPPFLPSLGGLSFPLFAPSMNGAGDPMLTRGRRGPQYPPSLDYDRPGGPPPPPPGESLSRMPSNSYYDSPQNPPSSGPSGGHPPRGSYGSSNTPNDRKGRYSRPEKGKYSPYGAGGPINPKGRGKGGSNDYGPPADPFYPDYGEDGIPRYSYNPSEVPKCAKESNVSYCIEDPEYPVETMQYEIDRDSSILEQIMPESDEKMELVEGISKKEDEKYNFRHYFTYRVDELDNSSKSAQQDQLAFGLKPDYYKDGGYICPSLVSYVQPRRARNTEGLWKVILNLRERYKGSDYKQNVRLEQCMHPERGCSFTSSFYNSQCIQKYNNMRLLAWTEERGIHLDIFRLPIACSCHFKGKVGNTKLDL